MQNPTADTIEPLLHKMADLGASDLHLKTGVPPMYRIGGELRRTNLPVVEVNSRFIERLMDPLIPAARRTHPGKPPTNPWTRRASSGEPPTSTCQACGGRPPRRPPC